MTRLRRLFADRTGTAAAEMALVVPIFVVLIFGTFELGHFFLSEHVVQKSVRDAARYAGRLPISSFPGCSSVTAADQLKIQNIARSGDPDGDSNDDGQADRRLQGWTAASMTSVTVAPAPSGTYAGIYEDAPCIPRVTVSAVVPYPTLFGVLGLGNANTAACQGQSNNWLCLTIGARSESAVFGA